jgi:hypothetical protein
MIGTGSTGDFILTLILFDFDGALADTLGDLLQFGQEACDELGVKHTATHHDLNSLEIMSFATYGTQLEVPDELLAEFVRRCLAKFGEKQSPPEIFEGLGEVVQELSASYTLESAGSPITDDSPLITAFTGPTSIFILPGYQFKVVDAMITNFHLPKSTLIMLVSAFAGRERILQTYETAIKEGYRFYSFGDAMFIW